jgi:thiol-disulfide isomerase/thioredoxin
MPFEKIGMLQDVDFDKNGNMLTHTFGANKKPVFFMIWGSYCGHCIKAKPAFSQVADSYDSRKVFFATLQTDDRDLSTQYLMKRFPQILQKHGIVFKGVPTFVLYKDGRYIEYDGNRDAGSFQNWLNRMVI